MDAIDKMNQANQANQTPWLIVELKNEDSFAQYTVWPKGPVPRKIVEGVDPPTSLLPIHRPRLVTIRTNVCVRADRVISRYGSFEDFWGEPPTTQFLKSIAAAYWQFAFISTTGNPQRWDRWGIEVEMYEK